MSYIARVLQAMNYELEYSPGDIAVITHLQEQDAAKCLHELAKGGMVECVCMDRYRKNRKYKTKQQQLRL